VQMFRIGEHQYATQFHRSWTSPPATPPAEGGRRPGPMVVVKGLTTPQWWYLKATHPCSTGLSDS
jgi:hypothetical protein